MPTERPLTAQELTEFQTRREKALRNLGLTLESTPDQIVATVDKYVDEWQLQRTGIKAFFRKPSGPDPIDLALGLGIIWGDQIVRAMGWEWVCMLDGGKELYSVVNPDRSLSVLPTYFLKACLDNPRIDCTALLSFNMLKAGKMPSMPPNSYTDYLQGVTRIVPKR